MPSCAAHRLSPPRDTSFSLHRNSSPAVDRKSTRLNSSHLVISYAVFCLKKRTDTLKKALEGGLVEELPGRGKKSAEQMFDGINEDTEGPVPLPVDMMLELSD